MLILFIDDDNEDYELFCQGLKTFDTTASCLHVHDGNEALIFLRNATILPDYIFLDINMPIMGGEECLISLKKNPDLKDIPVIMYSTTANLTEKETLKKLGAKDFIVKPATFGELVRLLKRTLN